MHRLLDDLVVAPFRELQFLASMRRGVARVPPPSIKLRIVRSLLKLHQPGTSFIAAGSWLADAASFDGRNSRPDLLQILTAVRAINPDY